MEQLLVSLQAPPMQKEIPSISADVMVRRLLRPPITVMCHHLACCGNSELLLLRTLHKLVGHTMAFLYMAPEAHLALT
jgi:hypothetical protein